MTDNDCVRTHRHDRVLEVTLDRPKANAIDAATSRRMGEVFADFRDDPDLRVAIVTGSGEKFFCAGWDLKSVADADTPDMDFGVGGFAGLQELPGLNKPVIAAVNGMAVGGGFCDQRGHCAFHSGSGISIVPRTCQRQLSSIVATRRDQNGGQASSGSVSGVCR